MDNKKGPGVKEFPLIALRKQVMLPGVVLHFDVARPASVRALRQALDNKEDVFLVTQRSDDVAEPAPEDVYRVGCVATIRQVLRLNDNNSSVHVVAQGTMRGVLLDAPQPGSAPRGSVSLVAERQSAPTGEISDQMERVKKAFMRFADVSGGLVREMIKQVRDEKEPGRLADLVMGYMPFDTQEKQRFLEQQDAAARLREAADRVDSELRNKELDNAIEASVQERMDANQHDYYLHEKLKAIYDELGEGEDTVSDADSYRAQIAESAMPEACKEKLLREVRRFAQMPASSPDSAVSRVYIEKVLSLPWGKRSGDDFDLKRARQQLDRDHYGLDEVKTRVIETLAALHRAPDLKGQIICLAGPPGVGKTSVAKSIAAAMGRKYARVALGGVGDESEIRGHRRTYIGSMPGRIINAIADAGTSDPLLLLDEIDKLSKDYKGDPASALLEVLDGAQNSTFTDHYIDMPFDLSRVLFITTANDKYAIPEPLLDRMEVIDMNTYTAEEKLQIAKRHLIPKQLKAHNLDKTQLRITDKAIRAMIEGWTRESGVRQLERLIAKICRKCDVSILEGSTALMRVTDKELPKLLGAQKYREDDMAFDSRIGLVNGLAWTSVGGALLQVEVGVMEGTGKLQLTGSLGDVMKESAQAAVSYVRSVAEAYGIDKDFYKNKDIHIHFPEGATPKDGPSAGVTIVTALVSALGGVPVRGDVAMTGEITLRGRVLPIGGLREKSMAAYTHSMKKIIMPDGNRPDLEKIDDAVRAKVEFIPVKDVGEVLSQALTARPQPPQGARA